MRQRYSLFACFLGLLYAVQFAFASPEAETEKLGAHIAVLLPLKSKSLGSAAQAVREGVEAASASPSETGQALLPIAIYPTDDSEEAVLAGYQAALDHHAKIVIGPLGRTPTAALAAIESLPLPTIALSPLETEHTPSGPLYVLTLSVEDEAKQIARLAYRDGARTAWTITTEPSFGGRMQASFAEEWKALGGEIEQSLMIKPRLKDLKALRASLKSGNKPDMIFLALTARAAKQVRPWLDIEIPTYATSQAYDGQGTQPFNMDLIRVRFVDQPWMVQPDDVSIMGYARGEKPMRADLERLYALGIDAWRVAQWIAAGRVEEGFEMHGVTGRLKLEANGHFFREPVAVQIGDETPVPLE